MTITGGNGCSSINYSLINHTPMAVNVIVYPDGSTHVGGTLNGSSGCPSCYISEENDQSVTNVNPGDVYTLNYATAVICNFGGSIYSTSGSWSLGIAVTYGKLVVGGAGPGYCSYNAACTNTSTPKCGSHGWTTNTNQNNGCSSYIWAAWLVVKKPSGSWICYGVNSNGLPVSGPGQCTPQ